MVTTRLPLPSRRAARLRVEWARYFRCFPRLRREIAGLGAYLAAVVAILPFEPRLWPLALVAAPLVGPYARRMANVRRHFAQGDVNAAKVLDPKTGLVACYADLGAHGAAFYPTVRLLVFPIAGMAGGPFASGDSLPAVCVYLGVPGGHKWDAFNPVPAACATSDPSELARLREEVPEWQWMALNEALFAIPRPYRAGLYPVGH